jgi:hypothetical protein
MTKSSAALLWDEPVRKNCAGSAQKGAASRIVAIQRPVGGPELYRRLDIRRRRAQIRARRALGLG